MITVFHENDLEKLTAMFLPLHATPSMSRPMVKPTTKKKHVDSKPAELTKQIRKA